MARNILLMTSTIRPRPNQPQLKVADPEERLAEYARALEFQCRLLERGVIDHIVYADNSGYDLAGLAARFSSPAIQWISFYDLDYDPAYHRGYGEFRLIDRAHRDSRILANMSGGDRVWKITGRYFVRNLPTIIALTPRSFSLLCQMRGPWAEMSVMAWSGAGYDRFIRDVWRDFATGMAPELILAERLHGANTTTCGIVKSFFWPPVIVGRRGTDGGQFQGCMSALRFAGSAAVKLVQLPFRAIAQRGFSSVDLA
jgi:hypothetical protein